MIKGSQPIWRGDNLALTFDFAASTMSSDCLILRKMDITAKMVSFSMLLLASDLVSSSL